jgi:hypothetical protein
MEETSYGIFFGGNPARFSGEWGSRCLGAQVLARTWVPLFQGYCSTESGSNKPSPPLSQVKD